jgi:DNA phosphorothioation-dependent restriction protein DptH
VTALEHIVPASADDHHDVLAEQLAPRLRDVLEQAGPGHRLRVTTLPEPVMKRLGLALEDPRWIVRVLNEQPREPYEATAATIIRLRDHAEAPVLVFFPPGPRTASEDSLDIATFTELSLASMAQDLADVLVERFAEPLRGAVREVVRHLSEGRQIRHPDEQVNYLLTVLKNGGSPTAAGAAVYLFGLVPDFELFTRGTGTTLNRVSRNQNACEKLADVNQPLQKRLRALNLKPDTLQQPLFHFFRLRHTEEPRLWGQALACDPTMRQLTFDRWEFADAETDGELRLILDPLNLPRQQADEVSGADRMPVLNVMGRDPLKVAFRSVPNPSQAPAWKNWRVQILALGEGGATVAWESNSYPKPAGGRLAKVRRSIKTKDLDGLDEGTYFLRVDAYDADGALLTTPRRIDPKDDTSRAENESEPFLVVREEVVIDDPDVRATFVPSLLAAWSRGALKALDGKSREPVPTRHDLTGSWNQPVGASVKGDVRFDLETDGFHGFAVVVPGLLRKVQVEFLTSPRALGVFQMALGQARTPGDIELVRKEHASLDAIPGIDAFLSARDEVFRRIRDQHLPPGATPEERRARLGIVEVVDLAPHADAIRAYAETFSDLVRAAMELGATDRAALLRALAWIDAVEIRWPSQPGDPGRGLLLAPTHPLRLLWHLRHTAECAGAVEAWDNRTHQVPEWRRFIEQIRDDLLPLNLPMAMFDRRGRAYTEALPITPFWGLYLPDRDQDGRHVDVTAARGRALASMGVKARSVAVTTVNPDDVAARLFEFVVQHPYVEQLRLNVFNPGSGELIADVLRGVEALRRSAKSPSSLRYAVHLFAPPTQLDTVGEAVEGLLDPERHVGEDDEFTLYSGNHLHPKLLVARNDVSDFVADHARFLAHLSILVEQFTARGRVGPVNHYRRGSYVGGLVQEPETVPLEATEGQAKQVTGWSKGVRPATRREADPMELQIADTLAAMHRLQAAVALGQPVEAHIGPVLALQLDAEAQGLLRQVHDVSDRVITIDRHLGVDFFDTPTAGEEAGYLLDFAPEFLQEERQRIVLTTRNTKEIEGVLSPMLQGYGINLRPGDEVMVLEGLRSLSGRLALRLEGSTTRAKEVVGLLFARWLLEEIGALQNRIVIPLDAHRSWFQGPGPQRRADLMLVGFPGNGIVRMDVIEVKLRDDLPPAARGPLYRSMREQTDTTEARLRALFDPDLYSLPRADLALRAKELSGVLSFYVRRAVRYGLLAPPDGDAALAIVERLDDGYRLDVQHMGIVFERLGSGHHVDEDEPGFTVNRFGANKARKLFHIAMGRFDERASLRGDLESVAPSDTARGIVALAEAPGEDRLLDALRNTLSVPPARTVRPPAEEAPPVRHLTAPSRAETERPALEPPAPAGEQRPAVEASEPAPTANMDSAPQANASDVEAAPAAAPPDADVSASTQPPSEPPTPAVPAVIPDVLIGSTELTPQYGVLGRSGSHSVAIDLNGCNTISLFGVQGFGKSYTLGVIAEMASVLNPGVNVLPSPLATVIFHFHKSDSYEPEYVTAVAPNRKTSEVDRLFSEYGARPKGLDDVVLLAPEAKVESRRREYPGVRVEPIKFSSSELGAESWKFLMGAIGNSSLYVRQIVDIMQSYGNDLTLADLEKEIEDSDFSKSDLRFANIRLRLARRFIDDSVRLRDMLKPGRTLIVDMRDEWMEKDQALGLFLVIMNTLAQAEDNGTLFNKLMVFDEAHKYISESGLIAEVVAMIREMRHWATSVVIASQDPLSVPRAIIELTSILVLHRMTSPQWLKHLRSAIVALDDLPDGAVTSLQPGEALVWSQRSTDKRYTLRPQKVSIRPRFTQHGGGTKTAVDGATIR